MGGPRSAGQSHQHGGFQYVSLSQTEYPTMKFATFKTITIVVIVFGVLGVAFWVSRVPYRWDEPISAPASSSAAIPAPTPPKPIFVVITSPTNGVVGTPSIQLKGRFAGNISSITYDVIDSEGCRTDQWCNYVISWDPGP